MERQPSLAKLDKSICDYYHKYNYNKKDSIFCYSNDKKQISEFYHKMSDNFYKDKLRSLQNSKRVNKRNVKLKIKMQNTIQDPLCSGLPKEIKQNNLIDTSKNLALKMSDIPIFSQVQTTKQRKYVIEMQIRQIVGQDIANLIKQKEQAHFRKRFPKRPQKHHNNNFDNTQTEQLMREFKRLVIKYQENKQIFGQDKLKLGQKENFFSDLMGDNSNDQKFRILALFKKMYLKINSQDINENLINYVLKFQMEDKLHKKMNNLKKIGRKKSKVYFSKATTPKRIIQNESSKQDRQCNNIYPKQHSHIMNIEKNKRNSLQSQYIKFQTTNVLKDINKMQRSIKERSKTSHFNSKIKPT